MTARSYCAWRVPERYRSRCGSTGHEAQWLEDVISTHILREHPRIHLYTDTHPRHVGTIV